MAAKKTITLIILRADRKVWDGDSVRLRVTALRKGLKVLYNKLLGPKLSTVVIELDLLFDAGQVYGISIDAADHRSAWQLINFETFLRQEGGNKIELNDRIIRLMLVPEKPSSTDLDTGWDRQRNAGSPMTADKSGLSRQSYLDLPNASKMALLNIDAKLRDTRVNGVSLLNFVESVRLVAAARLYLYMRAELKQIINDSSEFGSAAGHTAPKGTPIPLPAHPDSWKHKRFGAGNLQLSFAKVLEGLSGKQVYSVDADIDLGRGLDHVVEWLDNELLHPSKKTDQTQVYALLFSQGIIPHYSLNPL
jgi:hypothetical protein